MFPRCLLKSNYIFEFYIELNYFHSSMCYFCEQDVYFPVPDCKGWGELGREFNFILKQISPTNSIYYVPFLYKFGLKKTPLPFKNLYTNFTNSFLLDPFTLLTQCFQIRTRQISKYVDFDLCRPRLLCF